MPIARHDRGDHWGLAWRSLVFLLGFSSLACLLSDFYGVCPMRLFTPLVFVPALGLLLALAVLDGRTGDGRLCRAVFLGLLAGLLAAVSYDVFRLPFVFSKSWGLAAIIPPMNLFQVFPRFGAMILGQPLEQDHYSLTTSLLGWAYHFSNGATIGVMYLALVGDPAKRHWAWAVALAVALEVGMLVTPYPRVFGIAVTGQFIAVTMAAHAVFGVGLGLTVKRLAIKLTSPLEYS